MFMNYCYDFNDRKAEDDYIDFMYQESPKYDSRVNMSFVKGLEDKAELKKFCLDYIDHLDLNRMLVFAIIGLIYGFLMMLMDIFILHTSVWSIIVDSIVMIFTTFLIVQRNNIYTGTLNNYAIDKSTVVIKKSETTKRKHISKNAQTKKKSKKD